VPRQPALSKHVRGSSGRVLLESELLESELETVWRRLAAAAGLLRAPNSLGLGPFGVQTAERPLLSLGPFDIHTAERPLLGLEPFGVQTAEHPLRFASF
jgi:hypothetical protein